MSSAAMDGPTITRDPITDLADHLRDKHPPPLGWVTRWCARDYQTSEDRFDKAWAVTRDARAMCFVANASFDGLCPREPGVRPEIISVGLAGALQLAAVLLPENLPGERMLRTMLFHNAAKAGFESACMFEARHRREVAAVRAAHPVPPSLQALLQRFEIGR